MCAGVGLLYVRATRTSLLRAVRTGGAGQLAPGPHAQYVRGARVTSLGRTAFYRGTEAPQVATMLDTELVSLDSDSVRCGISGFLPLHAVTANRLKDMYNWLTDRRCDGARFEPGGTH